MHKLYTPPTSIQVFLAMTLLLGVTVGCKKKEEAAAAPSVAVQESHPFVGPISEEIEADAILAPLSEAAISPRINAPIRAEYVHRGAHVRAGQLLVTLEARDLQGSALDSKGAEATAQANYTATTAATIPEDLKKAQLDVKQADAALSVATRTLEERRKLFTQGAISGRDVDTTYAAQVQAQTAYDTAREHAAAVEKTTRVTDRESAQGQLISAKGRLESAEAQASYADLRSPITGVVTERPLFPGETASAGTPIITVMDTSSLLAKLHLAQASAQKLVIGRGAKVTVPGVNEPIDASVSFISPALDPGSTTVEVWLKLANADGHLKVGTPVHAVITGDTIDHALQVPVSAILPSQDGSTAVMLVTADSTAKKQPVKVGIRTADAVQILSGVTTVDTVITDGGYGLDDGTKVTTGKPAAGEDKD